MEAERQRDTHVEAEGQRDMEHPADTEHPAQPRSRSYGSEAKPSDSMRKRSEARLGASGATRSAGSVAVAADDVHGASSAASQRKLPNGSEGEPTKP